MQEMLQDSLWVEKTCAAAWRDAFTFFFSLSLSVFFLADIKTFLGSSDLSIFRIPGG